LTSDPIRQQEILKSVNFLQHELELGQVVYGVNTGFGGSADTRTQNFERLQDAAIQHLNVGILLKADKRDPEDEGDGKDNQLLRSHALPVPVVRASMLIRCNSLMRGHSAVRVSVIESVMKLLALDMTPVVPLRGSISSSGDLSTLSYIAGAIEGNPDIYVRIGGKGPNGRPKVIPASETLKIAGIRPVRLQAKEGLGITNGTAPSCAVACLAIHEANQLALLVQVLTAMGTEALDGTINSYDPFISQVRPHSGQTEVAHNIYNFLRDSKLCPSDEASSKHRVGLAQDRYPLRTAPQWIGPQLEDLRLATRQVEIELNSTTDNPLIDAHGLRVHHGGNFQAMAITSAMEKTMTALQNLGRLLFTQCTELINNATNKGLPPNLSADDPSASFTAKGFDVNMAAYAAELAYLARPVSSHVQIAEMANQSVNSMALVAGRYALEAVELVSLMAATYLYVLCQALDLRCLGREFALLVPAALKSALQKLVDGIEVKDELLNKVSHAIMQKWDRLAHKDLPDRSRLAVGEAIAELLEILNGYELTTSAIREFRSEAASALQQCYRAVRSSFFTHPTTTRWVSPLTAAVWKWVREELKVPMNRGVEDHPPLLVRRWKSGEDIGLKNEEEVKVRSRILGSLAGEIYEGLRRGELMEKVMKWGEKVELWV